METLNPRSLTDEELVRYYAMWLDRQENAPTSWQVELLRRFLKTIDNK
jgi:hypothetical protein